MGRIHACAVGLWVLALGLTANPGFAQAGVTTRASVGSTGQEGNGDSDLASISANGRFVAFESYANTLVSSDTNGSWDVFVHDRNTGNTTRVSVSSAGMQGLDHSHAPSISADGRFVAFWSVYDSHLVLGDNNNADDVFIHDRTTGETMLVSLSSSGAQGNGNSRDCSISATGRMVAFHSRASNLVTGDTNAKTDIFVRDRLTNTTARVSVSTSDQQGNDNSGPPAGSWDPYQSPLSISPDGRFVAFTSSATNLVSGDTNGVDDVFVRDRDTDNNGIYDEPGHVKTIRVSVSTAGAQGDGPSDQPSISAGGRFVVFRSSATNLIGTNDTNGAYDIFLRDRDTDNNGIFDEPGGVETRRASESSGIGGNSHSHLPSISGDGNFVAFQSFASNLVSGDTNGTHDIFVYERLTHTITRASLGYLGQASQDCERPSISGDGRFVAFETYGVLVPDDLNGALDVYVRDRLTSPSLCASVAPISRPYVTGGATPQADIRAVSLCAWPFADFRLPRVA
jgi:hypothetical protein